MTYLIQLLTIVQREGRKLVLCRRLLQLLLAQVRPHLQLLGLGRWRMEKTTAWLLGTVHNDRNIGFWWKRKLRQAATSDFNQMTLKRPLKLNARPHFQILRPAQPIKLQYFKSDQLHRMARKPRRTTTKYITANDPTHPHSHSFWRFPKLIRTLLLFCTCALLDFKLFPSLTFFWPTFTHSHAIIRTHYSPSQTIAFPTRNFQLLKNRNFRRSFKPNYSI